jgi:hypothetical protein
MTSFSGAKGECVQQFPTNGSDPEGGRNPYREAAPRPPSVESAAPPERATAFVWPASISRDAPEKLSAETRGHSFFVRTKKRELLSSINVLKLIAECPDVGDGEGVTIHRDVLFSLGYHLLDKIHELETARHGLKDDGPRYDERLSKALDQLGDKDAELKELRAALGEAAIKIRRLETKIFK